MSEKSKKECRGCIYNGKYFEGKPDGICLTCIRGKTLTDNYIPEEKEKIKWKN